MSTATDRLDVAIGDLGSVLSVDDLVFRYRKNGDELFDGLSHDFSPGRMTALTGPSGRGKSTLLYILGLMLTPLSGAVTVADKVVSTLPDRRRSRFRAEHMGFVFQDAALDPRRQVIDSVIEPALYAGWDRNSAVLRAMELMDMMGVSIRADHRPGEISGGQAQRVAVCRALMNNPKVILADEPTGNLDHENAEIVLSALAAIAEDDERTVIIATHDSFVIESSHEVLEL